MIPMPTNSRKLAIKQIRAAASNLFIESDDHALPIAQRNRARAFRALLEAIGNSLEMGATYKIAPHAEHADTVNDMLDKAE